MQTATTLTQTETIVLTAVLADYRAIEVSLKEKPLDWFEERFRRGARPELAYGMGVRIDHCRWANLPEHDPTISKRFQRAIVKLAKLGLLERANIYGNSKATHVRLTDQGRELAESLTFDQRAD